MGAKIRPLVADDLMQVARVHCLAFPESALSKLGIEVVRRYYDWQLQGPHDAVRIGVINDEELVGFCFFGKFRGATSGFVKKNRFYLIRQIAFRPWLLLGEEFRLRIAVGLKALLNFSPPQQDKTNTPPVPSFGILAIAVSPAAQGIGAGKLLMAEAERVASERGYERMNLSVSTKNHQAITFYERIGWQKVLEAGAWKGQMIKDLGGLTHA